MTSIVCISVDASDGPQQVIKIDYSSEEDELLPASVKDFERNFGVQIICERLNWQLLLSFFFSAACLGVDVFDFVFPHFSTLV